MKDSDTRAVGEKKIGDSSDVVLKLRDFINTHKAASPTDPDIFWIHLKPKEIASKFDEQYGIKISHGLAKRPHRRSEVIGDEFSLSKIE